jgi:hypothetical protein
MAAFLQHQQYHFNKGGSMCFSKILRNCLSAGSVVLMWFGISAAQTLLDDCQKFDMLHIGDKPPLAAKQAGAASATPYSNQEYNFTYTPPSG